MRAPTGAPAESMSKPSISQRRAKQIVERSGGNRIRRGTSERLEVGSGGLFERTQGTRTLRVGGNLTESTGDDHATRAKRVVRTVRGRTRIEGRTDNILLGGGMSEVHTGAEVVLAGMSDDLVAGAGTRVSAPLDLWVAGVIGIEEKLATVNADGAFIDTARTLFEREYGTGVHHAGFAGFSGAVYATQATGFRRLMKVSSGVRNLSSGGGGGGGGESAPASGPTSATPSAGAESEPGLLAGETASPGQTAGLDSTDLARLSEEARTAEDAAQYRRAENAAETMTELQGAARSQVAGEGPETAARAPSRFQSVEGPSMDAARATVDDAGPPQAQPARPGPDSGNASRTEPVWSPSSRRRRAYTKGQVRVGESFDEFRFEAVVGERPDKLLSDDAQDNWDGAAFGMLYEARDEVTDMSHRMLRRADPEMDPGDVSSMSAVDARRHILGLRNGAADLGDADEVGRLQDLLYELDHFAYDRYATGLADAEAVHEATPLKLPSHLDGHALEAQLKALAQEQFALTDDMKLSSPERHEASKLGTAYSMAAQDVSHGLHPLESLQRIVDSGLGEADAHVYSRAASRISEIITPGTARTTRIPAARSLWSRAGDIASSLLARVRFDSRPGGGLSQGDEISSADPPIRFLDEPQTGRLPVSGTEPPAPVHRVEVDPGPADVPGDVSPGGADPGSSMGSSTTRDQPTGAASRLRPSLDQDGAHWSPPDAPDASGGRLHWSEPEDA